MKLPRALVACAGIMVGLYMVMSLGRALAFVVVALVFWWFISRE